MRVRLAVAWSVPPVWFWTSTAKSRLAGLVPAGVVMVRGRVRLLLAARFTLVGRLIQLAGSPATVRV